MLGSVLRLSRLWRMMHSPLTIKDLFPDLPPEEQDDAQHALRRYLSFIVRLHARITSDQHEHGRLAALTRKLPDRSMEQGRSFTSQSQDTDI